jgi:hypothetical protein
VSQIQNGEQDKDLVTLKWKPATDGRQTIALSKFGKIN